MPRLERSAIDDWVSTHAHTVHHVSLAVIFISALVVVEAGLRRERRAVNEDTA